MRIKPKDVNERIQSVIKENIGVGKIFETKEYFMEEMRITDDLLKSLSSDRYDFTFRHMIAIHVICGVTLEWLVMGTGKKYRDDKHIELRSRKRIPELTGRKPHKK